MTVPLPSSGSTSWYAWAQDIHTKANGGGASGVSSVNTRTGAVTLTASDVGLGNVNNTADTAKPVSTAQQTALDAKVTNSSGVARVQVLTAAAYAALGTKVSDTFYVIVG